MAVRRRENEDLESLLRRHKRELNNSGVLSEIKKREYAMTKSQKRRKKQEEAALKRRKYERMQRRFAYRSPNEETKAPMNNFRPRNTEGGDV